MVKRSWMKKFYVCVLCGLLLITNFSIAENKEAKKSYYWLNFGPGIGPGPVDLQFIIGGSASYQFQQNIISARITHQEAYMSTPSKITERAILYGRSMKSKYWLSSFAAGLSYLSGEKSYQEKISTIGFPVEGQLFLTPLPFVGIGLYGLANFNLKCSFTGLLLCLQIGKLR